MKTEMIELLNISKKYKKGNDVFTALKDISFKIGKGDFCSVIGPSGAGKSTLLYVIGGLVHPDTGSVSFEGKNIYNLTPAESNQYRKKHLGFMFQQFHLMPWLTVEENIMLACYDNKQQEKIEYYLDSCSLKELKNKYPSELSVGEKQRTAFIRAIISQPDLLLADEPTGNLDTGNSEILMSLVKDYNMNGGTVVMVSHDHGIAKYANTGIKLEKGGLY
jgi:putative ABC transport system ATP-binding protein